MPLPRPSHRAFAVVTALFIVLVFRIYNVPSSINNSEKKVEARAPAKASFQSRLRASIVNRRRQIRHALESLDRPYYLPERLRLAREDHNIVGEHLSEIRSGSETVPEILHAGTINASSIDSDIDGRKEYQSMELQETIFYIEDWINQLHDALQFVKHGTPEDVWKTFHDLTVKTLYSWDREYLKRMPKRRDDGSIFLSIATYRDENCYNTISQAYAKAENPDNLFVGLVQQNCYKDCKSGVLQNGSIVHVDSDPDCYKLFCASEMGGKYCDNHQVRNIDIDDIDSLGPYAARYFASKLWYGEQWYMQIDAHMTFATHWDSASIEMLVNTPSKKPILSHYPPSHLFDFDNNLETPGSRICGPVFAASESENQIVRLEGSRLWDKKKIEIPRFAPFTAAGYFVAHSSFLKDVPFDPFLPWIFMGEEIIMSSRLWTAGYDIFSPSRSVVGHMYVRKNKPKFWESVHRAFTPGMHNSLQTMVLDRIKHQLGYPEAAKDMLQRKSLLTAVEQYSMGMERPVEQFLKIVGLNVTTKEISYTAWCETGQPPPGMEHHAHYYNTN